MSQAERAPKGIPPEVSKNTIGFRASNGQEYLMTHYSSEKADPQLLPELFFPGFGMSEKGYDELLRYLCDKGHNIYVLNSVPQNHRFRNMESVFQEEAVGVIEAVAVGLGFSGKEVVGIGNSMGGAKLLHVMNLLSQQQADQSFVVKQAILLSPAGMLEDESPARLLKGFSQDGIQLAREAGMILTDAHSRRRIIGASQDTMRNILQKIPYYGSRAWLIAHLHLRSVYERFQDKTTVISGEDEKTFFPNEATDMTSPGSHFGIVIHAEDNANIVDRVVREFISPQQ